jgi:hypothetical protein
MVLFLSPFLSPFLSLFLVPVIVFRLTSLGNKIEAVHKRVWNIHMWGGQCMWSEQRKAYKQGKNEAKRVTFHGACAAVGGAAAGVLLLVAVALLLALLLLLLLLVVVVVEMVAAALLMLVLLTGAGGGAAAAAGGGGGAADAGAADWCCCCCCCWGFKSFSSHSPFLPPTHSISISLPPPNTQYHSLRTRGLRPAFAAIRISSFRMG